MTKSELFIKAHENTRATMKENTELNYRVQFGLELSALQSKPEKETIIEKLEEQKLTVRLWEKYGKSRIYVEGFHYSKSFYIDLVEKKVVCNRPGTCSTAGTILEGVCNYEIVG